MAHIQAHYILAMVTLTKDKVSMHFEVSGKQITHTKDNRLIVDGTFITLMKGYDVNIQYTSIGVES